MDLQLIGKRAVVTGGSRRGHAPWLYPQRRLAALTKNLADELGRSGINVTVVHPGMTVTERTPAQIAGYAAAHGITEAEAEASMAAHISVGRIVTAAEIADIVAFLASPRSVAINGDTIAAGGGAIGAIHY